MNNRIIIFMIIPLMFLSKGYCKGIDKNTDDNITSFIYSNGEPEGIESIYDVDAPDNGFGKYYVYNLKEKSGVKVFPFVYQVKNESDNDESNISRCNIAVKVDDSVIIPDRKFNSDSSENSSPCIGFKNDYRVLKSTNNERYYLLIFDVLYMQASSEVDEIKEVYFYLSDKHRICYSEKLTSDLNMNKKINLLQSNLDFKECN
ncbi:MAG: hypothetical protein ACTH5S_15485 [Hafnia alvei]|uniref:hypothetical protein n=1 Tax=Hafnia alvei TaxID=569 RepID=UPI003F8EC1A2